MSNFPSPRLWPTRPALCLLFALGASVAATTGSTMTPPLPVVDPFIGVDAGGAVVPGACVPFGFVKLSPDTSSADTSGYASHGLILGFSHTHVSGSGGDSKYGNFRLTPAVGELGLGNLAFAKTDEAAAPGYYAVTLQQERGPVRCELTAGRLAGFTRFTFPTGPDGHVILNAAAHVGLAQSATQVDVDWIDPTHLSGSASLVGGWNKGAYTLYFWAEFDRAAKATGTWMTVPGAETVTPGAKAISGGQSDNYARPLGAYATFDTTTNAVVQVKFGVSFLSVAKARDNAQRDTADGFAGVRAAAEQAWTDVFRRIRVEGGTADERRIFYTALYHSHLMPHDLSDENAWWQSTEPHYEDFYCLWDTFRTLHPLFALIEPERQSAMVRSLVDTYRHTGWMPDARIAGHNGLTQGGSNSDVVIADAIVKKLPGIDYATAYAAMVKNAEVESDDPLNQGRELGDYLKLGYMSLSSARSASRTLEYAYDDFALSLVAERLGKPAEAARYRERARNWSKLWDPVTRCIRPRYADGRWLENYSRTREYPDGTTQWWDTPFYEGSGVQYSTFVPHDADELGRLLGGDEGFVAWLDEIFDRNLYTHHNEPDTLAPFLYSHAGRPDRTMERVRALLAAKYHTGRNGLPGNDDSGAMSSWYVWSALGLFPNAGQPFYYLTSPLFTRTVVEVGEGRQFVIEAPETSAANRFIRSATLNGRPLTRCWLTHEEVAAGGTLVLTMGAQPSDWGRRERPPALPVSSERAEPGR